MLLYSYPRSSASFRVRIALYLKGIPFEIESVDLLTDGQKSTRYLDLNPQGVVPTLIDDEVVISQSLAAIEYLEETHPKPSLLPEDPKDRARIRQLALLIACEIHPLQNLGVLRSLGERFGAGEEARRAWAREVIERGLQAFSKILEKMGEGLYCHGDRPGLADVFLVPQLFNARRFECDLRAFPRLVEIDARCMELEAFQKAAPEA
jgi:maleylacetoacetate isomerase